jgi:hypothetical protein
MDKKEINKKAEELYESLSSGIAPSGETFRRIALQMYCEGYKAAYEDAYDEAANDGIKDFTDEEFQRFWDLYYKKVDTDACKRLWKKLPRRDRALIFKFVPIYKQCQPDKRYRKNPATFLRHKGWLDELIPSQYAERQFQSEQRAATAARLAQGLFGLDTEEQVPDND